MLPRGLTVRGHDFEQVCVRGTGVGIYRGGGAYLRIGPGLERELATHRRMLREGFPVAAILEHGVHEGLPYFVEESLGRSTLGEIFDDERSHTGSVSDGSFARFTAVMTRYARAQTGIASDRWSRVDFRSVVGVEATVALVPDVGDQVREAFADASARLSDLPGTLVHGDLHADNTCSRGVIDLEDTGAGVLGYDVLTAAFVSTMTDVGIPGRTTQPWFSAPQLEDHLSRLDEILGRAGSSRRPTDELDAFLVCRVVSLCARRHRDPDIWSSRKRVLREALAAYRAGEELAARWGLRRHTST